MHCACKNYDALPFVESKPRTIFKIYLQAPFDDDKEFVRGKMLCHLYSPSNAARRKEEIVDTIDSDTLVGI